uniref:ribonuclease H n=1 Tax=Anser cygnoides TaxID=8845 RepID=A0A8B9DSM8_ANSCY
MGANGPARIKVPFTTAELDSWKEAVKGYRDDPESVARRFELIVKNLDPDWKDIEIMLAALSETEKQLVIKNAQTQVQTQVTSGVLPGTVEVYVPRVDPNWDYNDEGDYRLLKRYQEWIRIALESAIPKSVNWSRLYTIKQGQTETPSEFLDRLRTAMQKFTTIDPSSEEGKVQLVSLFLGQSADDIRRKLQKMKEPDVRDLERLVEEAWRVFRNREGNEKQRLGRAIAAATVAALQRQEEPFRGKGIKGIVDKFLKHGLLVECESEYNTPILPIKKPDGKNYRLVQDLRAINKITEDIHPVVANPYTLLTKLKDNLVWFTVLDLKDAFFCLTLAPESQKLFAFEWENPDSGRKAQLTWTVLPQGFKNSPTIFGNQLAKELEVWEAPNTEGVLLQYVDDLLIATENRSSCMQWTISLLNFLGLNGYRVSQQKAQLIQSRVTYLGFEISGGQRELGTERKETICRTPEPQTIKELRTFLGMTADQISRRSPWKTRTNHGILMEAAL